MGGKPRPMQVLVIPLDDWGYAGLDGHDALWHYATKILGVDPAQLEGHPDLYEAGVKMPDAPVAKVELWAEAFEEECPDPRDFALEDVIMLFNDADEDCFDAGCHICVDVRKELIAKAFAAIDIEVRFE